MVNLEVLTKFIWCEPRRLIEEPGEEYKDGMICVGLGKARWTDGTVHPLAVSIVFKSAHDAYDLKIYVEKFINAVLSIEELLKQNEAELL